MSIFKRKKTGGMADVIRCDQKDYLIWKWHPEGVSLGQGKRETAIRNNSVLRVKNGEVAVFVYKQGDGDLEDFIVGPLDTTLKTKNLPILSQIIGLGYEGDTPFQAEVFFINLAEIIRIEFSVPYFDVPDSRYPEFSVPIAIHGSMSFQIDDYHSFIKKHRLDSFDLIAFKNQVNDCIQRYIKDVVCNIPSQEDISVLQINQKVGLISQKAELYIAKKLNETFAVKVNSFDISNIDIDQSSQNFLELKQITKNLTAHVATIKTKAEVEDYAERLRIQREEEQYAAHKRTQQENLAAFQSEKQAEIGIAGAEALGKMGSNGNINLGGNSFCFNPASIAAGLTLGGAIGHNIANSINNSTTPVQQTGSLPPEVPETLYYMVNSGKSEGPYTLKIVQSYILEGKLNGETLLWKQGMENWEKAKHFSELSGYFPPEIPTQND